MKNKTISKKFFEDAAMFKSGSVASGTKDVPRLHPTIKYRVKQNGEVELEDDTLPTVVFNAAKPALDQLRQSLEVLDEAINKLGERIEVEKRKMYSSYFFGN